jgi:DNA-binding beta-propeller fold protein YncE
VHRTRRGQSANPRVQYVGTINQQRRRRFGTGRIVKFSKDGRFVKEWGRKGSAPGEFDEPHDLFVGGSRGWVYVADRKNNRIQIFDQDGGFVAARRTSARTTCGST